MIRKALFRIRLTSFSRTCAVLRHFENRSRSLPETINEAFDIHRNDSLQTKTTPYNESWVDDEFSKSLSMSTYLLALAIGNFSSISGRHKDVTVFVRVVRIDFLFPLQMNIYAPQHQKKRMRFSLDFGLEALDKLENFFGTAYPMPKCGK